ncbi:Ribosomal protein L7Ae/L30e/S12e/Gadd45 family protein [Euphorbia peplus]|nr:Ribosomal protein L7Ae/L30e/S12e/Gadd45 family protein [Euphorbia peplus]
MANKKGPPQTSSDPCLPQEQDYYQGERLARLLKLIHGGIESAKVKNSLPEKFWFKQQFAIGVNEVTRALERMLPTVGRGGASAEVPTVHLQAILIAHDSNPKWLTKHLPGLASTKNVPVIFVKDKKGGSLRLGELVRLKTAIAVGIKAKGNSINQIVEEILRGDNETENTDD